MLFPSILSAVGNTPTVKLNRIGSELACELYVKCEFMNPGGSIKDRIAISMIEDAEKKGLIQPGDTLIEATSGNTGIGLAMAAAVKGYELIITLPEKNSQEKLVLLESMGATIYRTPNVSRDHPDSYVSLAIRLQKSTPNSFMLNQFSNHSNAEAHYRTTAQEIIEDMDGRLDMIVMSMGTGGTIMGVSKKLKEYNPNIRIIGVDPKGSLMTGQAEKKSFLVEGIGSDFIPDIFNKSCADTIIHTEDKASFIMARRLIREEGLLVGGSSGSAVCAMLEAAQALRGNQRVLAILPDGIRNYLSKFADAKWMHENQFV